MKTLIILTIVYLLTIVHRPIKVDNQPQHITQDSIITIDTLSVQDSLYLIEMKESLKEMVILRGIGEFKIDGDRSKLFKININNKK